MCTEPRQEFADSDRRRGFSISKASAYLLKALDAGHWRFAKEDIKAALHKGQSGKITFHMVRSLTRSMQLKKPMDDVFTSRSHVRVLRALDGLPDGVAVSGRELARRSGVSHPTASRVLASLAEQGVVQARRSLAADAFMLNPHHVSVERLRSLFAWERELLDEFVQLLTSEIKREAPWVEAAFLFGSSIRDDMTSGSDVDLAVVIPDSAKTGETREAFERIADVVRGRFGNRLDLTIGTAPVSELRRADRRGHRLWGTILRDGMELSA